jgi:hypothetical protein
MQVFLVKHCDDDTGDIAQGVFATKQDAKDYIATKNRSYALDMIIEPHEVQGLAALRLRTDS